MKSQRAIVKRDKLLALETVQDIAGTYGAQLDRLVRRRETELMTVVERENLDNYIMAVRNTINRLMLVRAVVQESLDRPKRRSSRADNTRG